MQYLILSDEKGGEAEHCERLWRVDGLLALLLGVDAELWEKHMTSR